MRPSLTSDTVMVREISEDRLDNTFRTNLYAYVWMAQAAAEHLGAGDCIINTGSVVAVGAPLCFS